MAHKAAALSLPGSPGNPITLLRRNPAADRAIRVRNTSNQSVTVKVRHTNDVNLWDADLPEYTPVTVVLDSNDNVDFDEGGSELVAVIAPGTYATPELLAAAVKSAMTTVGSDTIECTWVYDLHKFRIRSEVELNILWNTGTNGAAGLDTSAADDLGFDDSSDSTGSLSYLSDSAVGSSASWTSASDVVVGSGAFVDTTMPAVGKILELSTLAGIFEIQLVDGERVDNALSV